MHDSQRRELQPEEMILSGSSTSEKGPNRRQKAGVGGLREHFEFELQLFFQVWDHLLTRSRQYSHLFLRVPVCVSPWPLRLNDAKAAF